MEANAYTLTSKLLVSVCRAILLLKWQMWLPQIGRFQNECELSLFGCHGWVSPVMNDRFSH
jgi:hypothetical protein